MIHKELLIDLGIQVKEARNKKKYTQKEFGDILGITHEWVCKIENGKVRTISFELYCKIIHNLNSIDRELKTNI